MEKGAGPRTRSLWVGKAVPQAPAVISLQESTTQSAYLEWVNISVYPFTIVIVEPAEL